MAILENQAQDISRSAKEYRNTHPYKDFRVNTYYPTNTASIRAFGADDYSGIGDTLGHYLYDLGYLPEDPFADTDDENDDKNNSGKQGSSLPPGASSDMQAYINYMNEITDRNNAFAADQAMKQMAFQDYMSSTAHQREVQDLKAAGLNPVLSASGGTGAATGSGAMAQPDTTNSRILGELALSAIEGLGTTAIGLAGGFNSVNESGFNWDKASKTVSNLVSRIMKVK